MTSLKCKKKKKKKKPYSTGEELIKPSLIAACSKVSGQSAASKMKDIPLSNDTVWYGRRYRNATH